MSSIYINNSIMFGPIRIALSVWTNVAGGPSSPMGSRLNCYVCELVLNIVLDFDSGSSIT